MKYKVMKYKVMVPALERSRFRIKAGTEA